MAIGSDPFTPCQGDRNWIHFKLQCKSLATNYTQGMSQWDSFGRTTEEIQARVWDKNRPKWSIFIFRVLYPIDITPSPHGSGLNHLYNLGIWLGNLFWRGPKTRIDFQNPPPPFSIPDHIIKMTQTTQPLPTSDLHSDIIHVSDVQFDQWVVDVQVGLPTLSTTIKMAIKMTFTSQNNSQISPTFIKPSTLPSLAQPTFSPIITMSTLPFNSPIGSQTQHSIKPFPFWHHHHPITLDSALPISPLRPSTFSMTCKPHNQQVEGVSLYIPCL